MGGTSAEAGHRAEPGETGSAGSSSKTRSGTGYAGFSRTTAEAHY